MTGTLCGAAEVGGARLYYELAGEGPPLVLLHAGICDGRMWDEQFEIFARDYRVLRYDRRGFGRTPGPAGAFSHAEDLAGLLRHFRMGRAALVGCSQGGRIALEAALLRPESVAALVLVSPALPGYAYAAGPPPQAREVEEAEAAGDLDRVNELELQIWVDGPRRAPGEVDGVVRERVRAMNRVALSAPGGGEERPAVSNVAERLGEIRVPALVVAGDLDTPRTFEAAEALAKGVAGARLACVRGAAHLPNMERPGEFNRLVLQFLGEQFSGGSGAVRA